MVAINRSRSSSSISRLTCPTGVDRPGGNAADRACLGRGRECPPLAPMLGREMSDELRERLRANAQRRRAERGLPKRHEIATALEEAFGHRVPTTDFLSVQATDALMEAVGKRVKGMAPQATWVGVSPLVVGGMAVWADSLEETWAYLYVDGSELAGMAYVPVAPFLRNLARFWKPPSENLDLVLATVNGADGLWLAWQGHVVDLWVWGEIAASLR